MDIRESVYLETTIVSYLVSRPSRNIVVAARQEITKEWWNSRRPAFDIFISERVIYEAAAGDEIASRKRLDILKGITVLELSDAAVNLADKLFVELALPRQALEDAFHIAISVTCGMDYLLTWNCKHIANALLRHKIRRIAETNGYLAPVICTPQELMEDYVDD